MTQQQDSFSYRMCSTGHNSERYGPCEVCHEHCSEVFTLREMRGVTHPETGEMYFAYYKVRPLAFGHKECLIPLQRVA